MKGVRIISIEPEGLGAAYDPIEVLIDGPRVYLQVERACFELNSAKALLLGQALHRASDLAYAAPVIRDLLRLVEALDELEGGKLERPEIEAAKRWFASHGVEP